MYIPEHAFLKGVWWKSLIVFQDFCQTGRVSHLNAYLRKKLKEKYKQLLQCIKAEFSFKLWKKATIHEPIFVTTLFTGEKQMSITPSRKL